MKHRLAKLIFVAALIVGVLGVTGVAFATVTLNATSVTSSAALTLTATGAASTWSLASDGADDDLTVGVTGATDSSLILSSTGTGADALQITTSAGGLDISVTGTVAGEDLDITTVGATTEMRLSSASTEDDALVLSATADTGGVHILAGDGEVAAVGTDESIELRATADTIVALTAAGSLVVDAATTVSTNTDGALDLNFASITNATEALNIAATANSGLGTNEEISAVLLTLANADADGEVVGLDILATDAAGNAADMYTVGIRIDSAETTAANMTDAILITSSGVDAGVTDALDVSAANITNAINIGANNILSSGTVTFSRATTGAVTLTAVDDDTTAAIVLDAGGAASVTIGSADVTQVVVTTDNGAANDVAITGGLTVTSGATHNSFTVTSSADTETAATITANSVTTGNALSVSATGLTTGSIASLTGTNTAIADTAAGISQVVLATTNAQGTAAQTLGGGVNALRVNFTNNPTIAGNTENVVMVQNQVTTNATDNAVAALLLLDNADTSGTGSTVVTSALLITNTGNIVGGVVNAININDTDVTTDIVFQNGETLDNDVNNQFLFSAPGGANTVTITAADSDANAALTVASGGTGTATFTAGGAGAVAIGTNASTTSITLATDGTGDAEVVLPNASIGEDELAASLVFDDGDLVSFASVSVTSATEGLILPQHATDCSVNGTAEGQVCWEADANVLYIGDGATVAAITPNTTSNNTWTGTNTYQNTLTFTMAGAEQVAMTAAPTDATGLNAFQLTFTALDTTSGTTAQYAVYLDNAASTEAADAMIVIDNSDGDTALTAGILFAGNAITTAIDASLAGIVTALNVGPNAIEATELDFNIAPTGGTSSIAVTASADAEDFLIDLIGNFNTSLTIRSAGNSTDALVLSTTAGGMDITVAGNLDTEDLDITATGATTEIRVSTASTEADAFRLNASAGGIDIDATNSTLTITNTANGAADDFTISQAGAQDASLHLSSAGTGTDALTITASAGGMVIAAGEAAGAGIASTVNVISETVFDNTANVAFAPQTLNTGDNAAYTLTPASSFVLLQCNKAAAGDTVVTMSETGAVDGQLLIVVVDSDANNAGTCSFSDSAGVQNMAGTTVDDSDSIMMIYEAQGATTQWIQLATSNN